ncbi:protein kinase [Streptomyces sp. NPDC001536]|uniref:serine/threonine protein kinase n=1 Tax=Streptomyces sp. NPDC001536 TaxID=3364583 RepID=UPI0036B25709
MGEVFAGRYELVDPIGRGGVGAVWRAWDHRRRRYVAAKVLQQSDAHSLLRFVREQALRIDHPHVLAPASWAADDDKVLFTMDLVGGGSLAHLIGDYGPLPPSFVCTLLDQLLSGLAAVHAEDVVHRDIKPANVLLEATGTGRPRLRLSDFGIAMRLGEPRLTETNLVVGTPGYISPEQMMGSEPDFPADLFAVGLVALYLLEGAKPDAKALVQYFAAHGTPSAPKGIPEPLWQVVATLVQPDPQARFRTATGARKALAAAAELLPEPSPDDELIEIFDQLGPLPPGFGPAGPLKPAPGVRTGSSDTLQASDFSGPGTGSGPRSGQVAPGPSAGLPPSGPTDAGPSAGFPPSGQAAPEPSADLPSPVQASPGPGTGVRPPTRDDDSAWPGTDSVSADPRRGHAPGAVPPDPRQSTGPRSAASLPESSGATRPPSMSDTGSFPLPPPQATASSPQTRPPHAQTPGQAQQSAQHQPSHVSPDDPTHVLPSPRPQAPPYPTPPPPLQRADASTASYTAQVPQVPPPAQEISRHRAGRGARRARRRPGPPAKVVVPLLLLALACYAVGFWALTRI